MGLSLKEYLNQAERFFLVARFSGLVLSPKDIETIRQYYIKGIPLRLVLEGISEGLKSFLYHRAPGQRIPHSLNYYSHFIGAKVRKYRKGDPVAAADRPHQHLAVSRPAMTPLGSDPKVVAGLQHLVAEVEVLALAEEREAAHKAKEMLLAGLGELLADARASALPDGTVESRLLALDEAVCAFYHGALAPDERQRLDDEVKQRLGSVTGLGNKAMEGRSRTIRLDLLRDHLQMPVLCP